MITVVQPEVIACGHKLKTDRHPNNNCASCWTAYFVTQTDMTVVYGELRGLGVNKFRSKYGSKYTKMLSGYIISELHKGAERAEQASGLTTDVPVEIESSSIVVAQPQGVEHAKD